MKMNTKRLSITLLSGLILASIALLAACSPLGIAPLLLAQPHTIEKYSDAKFDGHQGFGEDVLSRSWEIDAHDIAAAREAAEALSQTYAVGLDFGEDVLSRSWEIDPDDISAAREAAETLSRSYAVEVEDDLVRSWEISVDDIAAARIAAQTLSKIVFEQNTE